MNTFLNHRVCDPLCIVTRFCTSKVIVVFFDDTSVELVWWYLYFRLGIQTHKTYGTNSYGLHIHNLEKISTKIRCKEYISLMINVFSIRVYRLIYTHCDFHELQISLNPLWVTFYRARFSCLFTICKVNFIVHWSVKCPLRISLEEFELTVSSKLSSLDIAC